MKKWLIIFFLSWITLCVLPVPLVSQVIIPNTPSSASLMKEVQRPTVASSGLPNIFIPLLNEGTRGSQFPVNLRYNSGGFKINEESGWVGLGWYLDCEFQITRRVNGLDDFLTNGYPKAATTSPLAAVGSTIPNSSSFYRTQYQLASGTLDGEPDEFTFRLRNGKSGKFYFQPHSTLFLPIATSDPKMKITFNVADYSFKIIDSDGTIYTFAAKSSAEFKATDGFEMSSDNPGQQRMVITWKCTRIQDYNNRNEVVFSYVAKEKTEKIRGRSHIQLYTDHQSFLWSASHPLIYAANIRWQNYSSYEAFASFNPFYRLADPKYFIKVDGLNDRFMMLDYGIQTPTLYSLHPKQAAITSYKKTYAQLSSITLNGGTTISFDLNGTSDEVKSLTVKKGAVPIRSINFFYSKPTHTSGLYQFSTSYLDSLVIVGGANTAREKYAFRYHSKPVLGAFREGADAWGYFNGSSSLNTVSTIPSIELHEPFNFVLGDRPSNMEYPDESLSLSGVLTDILYPTGGFTNYVYENHRYKYQYWNRGDNADIPNGRYNRDEIGTAILFAGGLRIKEIKHYNGSDPYPEMSSVFSYGYDGTGQLVNQEDVGLAGFVSVFPYPPNSYQGWIFTPFRSSRNINYLVDIPNSGQSNGNRFQIGTREKLTTFRSRHFALGANSYGSSVFYDKITEHLIGRDSVIGKIEDYYYKPSEISPSYASDNLTYSMYISGTDLPRLKNYWYMDVKKKTMKYGYLNGSYTLKKEARFTYSTNNLLVVLPVFYSYFNEVYEIVGNNAPPRIEIEDKFEYEYNKYFPNLFSHINYTGSDMELYDPSLNYSNGSAFIFGRYDLPLGFSYLEKAEEINYENNGSDSLKRSTSYSYRSGLDNRMSTTKEVVSMGGEKITRYTYPDDSIGVAAYNIMSQGNNIAGVITENVSLGASSRKEDQIFRVFPTGNKVFLSANKLYHNGVLSKTTTILKYDSYGNPLELVGQDGRHTVYIWGNQGERLLFSLENLTYETFILRLDQQGGATTILNGLNVLGVSPVTIESARLKLHTLSTGTSSMVTSYRYNPQGLLSGIENSRGESTSYFYDDLQRLLSVLDQDGNVVRSHNYNSRSNNVNWFKEFNDSGRLSRDIKISDVALNGFARMVLHVNFDPSKQETVRLRLQHQQSGQIYGEDLTYESSRLNQYNFYFYSIEMLLPLGDYSIWLEDEVSRLIFVSNEMVPGEDFWSRLVDVTPVQFSLKSNGDVGYYFISLSSVPK